MTDLMVVNHTNTNTECDIDNICEICYGNKKCDKYNCKECDNSICIRCAESCSKIVLSLYDEEDKEYCISCPYCRNDNYYNYDDLTWEEYKVFYMTIRRRIADLKKPIFSKEKIITDRYYDFVWIKSYVDMMIENPENKSDKKFYEKLKDDIVKITNKKNGTDKDDLLDKYQKATSKLIDLKYYKELYESNNKYNNTIKSKLLKHQGELEKQTELMRNMERQNELLLQQNRDLFSKVNDVYNIVKNSKDIRKPQQVIKTIASNFKDVVENKQLILSRNYNINISLCN